MKIEQIAAPDPRVIQMLLQEGSKSISVFRTSTGCGIIHSMDTGPHGILRHLSISHPQRYPTWEEIKEAKEYFFKDDEDAMMVLPRKELYVNLHPNCFHVWQLPFKWEVM